MIDASSKHSFEDNIALTKQVVEYAHAHRRCGRRQSLELWLVSKMKCRCRVWRMKHAIHSPEEVEEFVDRTGCRFSGNRNRH